MIKDSINWAIVNNMFWAQMICEIYIPVLVGILS